MNSIRVRDLETEMKKLQAKVDRLEKAMNRILDNSVEIRYD